MTTYEYQWVEATLALTAVTEAALDGWRVVAMQWGADLVLMERERRVR